MVVGILLAFLLESLDTGLRSIAEIESVTELPSLAIVPRARRATPEQLATMTVVERNVNVLTQPKSQFTEAFRSLRTALLLSSTTGREPKYILCTSATPSEGKTTAASNLAVILAQRGTRVLLIDADLRRPNVHHRFGLNGKLASAPSSAARPRLKTRFNAWTEVPGLDILASGAGASLPHRDAELAGPWSICCTRAGETVHLRRARFAARALGLPTGVLLFAAGGRGSSWWSVHGNVEQARGYAADAICWSAPAPPLAGIVLNAVDLNAPEYYGYYGYSGYSYSSLDPRRLGCQRRLERRAAQPGHGASGGSSDE